MTAIYNRGIDQRKRVVQRTALAALLAVLAPGLCAAQARTTGAYFIPGDPKSGMRVFFEKGCARCHSVLGEGGRTAPDLARAPAGHLSAAELVSAMWNHAPEMWEEIQAERLPAPKFSEEEMTDLFAFLYSVRSLDEPGDPRRGRQLLTEKHCSACHAVSGEGGATGPDFARWAKHRNPVSWIQAMWNHGTVMQRRMGDRGLAWPEFQGNDMADIAAYVRSRAAGPRGHAHMRRADPDAGRRVFTAKGCAGCHASGRAGGRRAPDLTTLQLPRTLGQFAAVMWNHGPAMWSRMQAQQVPFPEFSNQQMADLIAYLFTERFFEAPGNAERGRRSFAEKGCTACHGQGQGAGSVAGPDLTRGRRAVSPVAVAAALWNHGPLMLEQMREQQMAWPRFRQSEMVDLMEFLERKQRTGSER